MKQEYQTTKGLIEVEILKCNKCGKNVTGHSIKQAKKRLEVHQTSKQCLKTKK